MVAQVSQTAANAAAASAAKCDIGVQMDAAGNTGMAMSIALTSLMTTSYSESQLCSCDSGAGVVQFPAESLMAQALQAVKAEAVSNLDASGAKQYATELAASLAPSFSNIVESLTVFADDNCRPGSGGVLDQSFACGELSAGNETELAYATGAIELYYQPVSSRCHLLGVLTPTFLKLLASCGCSRRQLRVLGTTSPPHVHCLVIHVFFQPLCFDMSCRAVR